MAEEDKALSRAKDIVLRKLAPYPVRVILFGSYARQESHALSDIDVAVEPLGPLPRRVLAELREALDESTVPRNVEIVDLRDADAEFRRRVHEEGVVWSGSDNG
ncbi:MAG: nucleotidyltransferase family protein [Acidobacteriota bacterium]